VPGNYFVINPAAPASVKDQLAGYSQSLEFVRTDVSAGQEWMSALAKNASLFMPVELLEIEEVIRRLINQLSRSRAERDASSLNAGLCAVSIARSISPTMSCPRMTDPYSAQRATTRFLPVQA
jgi:hypothetical protein